MKILLVGEFSNVHNTLAQGLRALGHKVCVASNGDYWKDYPRDIDLSRSSRLSFTFKLVRALLKMRDFDIVQLIGPRFIDANGTENIRLFEYLRKHNGHVVLGAMGDDYYYSHINSTLMPMRFSDFNFGKTARSCELASQRRDQWENTDLRTANIEIARNADAIVAGAYEFWLPYHLTDHRSDDGNPLDSKLHYIPFPIVPEDEVGYTPGGKLRLFIGISKGRSEYKGTDILLRAAQNLLEQYPERMELVTAEGVPYDQYRQMLDSSDVLLDQIYAYGPGMNALLAMSKGLIAVTGGEPEHYDLLDEHDCQPIINIEPTYESVYKRLEWLVCHPEEIAHLRQESRRYVMRNYDCMTVAKKYEKLYSSIL
ncbi:MAG: glycosyltransferase family 1 protein [Bacteroidales bacterium]|nr:glycosyltransferase family 1 protein [Candidatus Liminaster caballi]